MLRLVEYIWLDGTVPTPYLRSKTRTVFIEIESEVSVNDFPEWSFDGSSTNQAVGENSDCILKPVAFVDDPIRDMGSYLVLCEVFNKDGTPHKSNTRFILRETLKKDTKESDFWVGFEQEYTLYKNQKPLGWPEEGYPAPQGPYYCGVGTERVYGRELVEAHLAACLEAGLMIYGINAEVMPGQWEFQVGYRGLEHEKADALMVSDHRYLALWLLHRIAEEFEVTVSIDNKPIKGDWNGAGCHTNFSTKAMRSEKAGGKAIKDAIFALEAKHAEHIKLYGHKLEERLTGVHETSSIKDFSAGDADRGASIRIPPQAAKEGCGYLEDRRPGANCDAYLVSARLIATVCGLGDIAN